MERRDPPRGAAVAVLLTLAPALASWACQAPERSLATAAAAAASADLPASVAARVIDDAGLPVPLEPVPRRIVSLVPSATELLVALGVADRLVARTAHDGQPALARLPSLGRTLAPSLESVQALLPDLVLAPSAALAPGVADRLRALGTRVYVVDVQRASEVFEGTRRVATLVGEPERGDSIARSLEDELEALRRALAETEPVDALYLVWHDPPLVAGAGTWVDDLMAAAGARNVFADVEGWAEVSLEAVVERDPRHIVVPAGEGHSLQPEWLRDEVGWRGLAAVREGRMIVVDSDLFSRPGPALARAAWTLARELHREIPPREARR